MAADLKGWPARAILWVLASPVLACVALWRARQRYVFLRIAMAPHLPCSCGTRIWLLGLWRCSCGFTYQGHLLRYCPVCLTIPRVVRCYRCGVTTTLPEAD